MELQERLQLYWQMWNYYKLDNYSWICNYDEQINPASYPKCDFCGKYKGWSRRKNKSLPTQEYRL